MAIDDREKAYFERLKALLEEQETLKADLAQLKADAEEGGLSKERIADLVAVAKLQVMDQAKRDKKDTQARRRAELEGQLSMLPAEPRKAASLSRNLRPAAPGSLVAKVGAALDKLADSGVIGSVERNVSLAPLPAEPPHDPETGEVEEAPAEPSAARRSPPLASGATWERQPEGHYGPGIPEIPAHLDRTRPDHPLYAAPRVKEAAE